MGFIGQLVKRLSVFRYRRRQTSVTLRSNDKMPSEGSSRSNAFFPHESGPSLEGVASLIASDSIERIVVLAGAGISTSAVPPIPDFRTPGTGLYSNLSQYNLPYAEAIFDINYFQRKPQPFFTLAKELYPGNFKPSLTHYFFALLHQNKKLLRVFTQNVDTLERIAGLPSDKIVEAHGSFASASCLQCKKQVDEQWMRDKVMQGEIARCPNPKCSSSTGKGKPRQSQPGLVKPDIVFFGEGLPERFFRCISDLRRAQLLIVLGTSLQVHPFAGLVDAVPDDCPRVLINLERVGELAGYSDFGGGGMRGSLNETGFDFDGVSYGGPDKTRDVFWGGKADEGILQLAEHLGWKQQLIDLRDRGHANLDNTWNKPRKSPTKEQIDPAPDEKPRRAESVTDKSKDVAEKVGKAADSKPSPLSNKNQEPTTSAKDPTDDLAAKLDSTTLQDRTETKAPSTQSSAVSQGSEKDSADKS
ncbi:NAD-dependent deacetylase sirtuin-2 [Testicularia cyperi]|uniref:protein acetyllysine N-acetyltransferase n=1 Tax=Testicularia cyperi TaxID=1882483 RepID=A0A317XTS8_9BASI|nr:NAD-dependent deacetylase sirtuin-2 [Testicularia cyperi]